MAHSFLERSVCINGDEGRCRVMVEFVARLQLVPLCKVTRSQAFEIDTGIECALIRWAARPALHSATLALATRGYLPFSAVWIRRRLQLNDSWIGLRKARFI